MSLSTMIHVPSTVRREHSGGRTLGPRRRLRNARRALAVAAAASASPPTRGDGVRLHPVELGPWDD